MIEYGVTHFVLFSSRTHAQINVQPINHNCVIERYCDQSENPYVKPIRANAEYTEEIGGKDNQFF